MNEHMSMIVSIISVIFLMTDFLVTVQFLSIYDRYIMTVYPNHIFDVTIICDIKLVFKIEWVIHSEKFQI